MAWKVVFFTTSRGDSPIVKFLSNLDHPTHAKVIRTIELLQHHGLQLPPPYSKKVFNNLYELRTSGSNPIRILYSFHSDTFYLLHVLKKKSQKLPSQDIQTALDRRNQII